MDSWLAQRNLKINKIMSVRIRSEAFGYAVSPIRKKRWIGKPTSACSILLLALLVAACYSVRKLSTGFARADFIAWKLIVINATESAIAPAPRNSPTERSMR